MVEKVGVISFGNRLLNVYSSLDSPLFMASEISSMIDYSRGNVWGMLSVCEDDEKLNLPMVVAGQKRNVSFVNENGLYNVLSESRKPLARKWRRIIHDELINLRKSRGKNVVEQFEDWDHELDNLFIDPDTGIMMQSVTVPGGDVIQIPYNEEQ
ncbi:BRO family protein [Bacteroides sp.]|uniref:BRO-N domain-containing protein n=1 Tax=Bacteroides sp. TaxID=29523 RepID=UPI0026217606|nr:BRO family protein [Bacteroides sp.]MDD3040047.1 BRO family protein [Bacteroides sp.]